MLDEVVTVITLYLGNISVMGKTLQGFIDLAFWILKGNATQNT